MRKAPTAIPYSGFHSPQRAVTCLRKRPLLDESAGGDRPFESSSIAPGLSLRGHLKSEKDHLQGHFHRQRYLVAMNAQEFFFTSKAHDAFREVVLHMQEVSLIAAERVRARILHRIHLIHHHPLQSSKKVEFKGLNGHFRMADVLNYRLFYLVEEDRIILMDILMDKEVSRT